MKSVSGSYNAVIQPNYACGSKEEIIIKKD